MQPSRLEAALCAASSGIPASCTAAKKVDQISHALHLCAVVARTGGTAGRVTAYAKSLTFKKLLT